MKKIFLTFLFFAITISINAQSASATYNTGDIPTTYITSASVTTESNALEPGELTVTIPIGDYIITSVDVQYDMTARNGAYMAEQRSFLRCVSTGGTTESQVYSGIGNSEGTYSYNRTGLEIANNVTGGGGILFELHAFRTYFGSGSNTDYQFVNNSTFTVTVYYSGQPEDVTNFTATMLGATQIKLSWTKNGNSDNTLLVYNTTNTFGTPTNGTSYDIGDVISGGGTVIYKGSNEEKLQVGLTENTAYYYKIWSYDINTTYSAGVTTSAETRKNPVVSNVTFSITGEFVDIYYDLTGGEGGTVKTYIEVSDDGGVTFDFPATQVTGDIGTGESGTGITYGEDKHISWHFGREHSGVFGDNFVIKIIADDLFGDQIYYAGQIYNTVTIGTQTWLKENLNVGTMINSTYPGGFQQTENEIIEKYCYDNNESNCATYGGLYEWTEAMQYVTTPGTRGICPEGWHIPTYDEFVTLKNYVGSNSNALKAEGQGTGGGAGTNTSGFSALLVGYRGYNGTFGYLGNITILWSSTEYNSGDAKNMALSYYDSNVDLIGSDHKDFGFSVRCVKD